MKIKEICYRETISKDFNNCAYEMRVELEEGENYSEVHTNVVNQVKQRLYEWEMTPKIEVANKSLEEIITKIKAAESQYENLINKIRKVQRVLKDE